MKMSSKGLDLVKSFEGLYTKAYLCPAGVWTIGYGHTGKVDGKPISSGMVITAAKATKLLADDMNVFEKGVERAVKVKLNQNQFDALVSFSFNCGLGALNQSTLLKLLNKNKYEDASKEFLKWNKGGGRVLAGLTRRREAEKKLFCMPIPKKTNIYTFKKFVKELEKISNLTVDGIPDKALLRILPSVDKKKNSTNPVIKPLKKILKKKGYKITNTKAEWDNEIALAVKQYKRAHAFESETEAVGSGFWKKILKL